MTADGGLPAADVTYGIDIGGTKVLGIALGPAGEIVAEARVATPTGTRVIVGSHVAQAVAAVVADLDRQLAAAASIPVGVGRAGNGRPPGPAPFLAQPPAGPRGGLDRAHR